MKKVYLLFSLIALFAVGAFAQSPNVLRQKCHNSSSYAIVQIAGDGAVNIDPCSGKVVTISSAVVFPSFSFSMANGTAAAPSLFFTNSTTTGFYRASADVLGIGTAGVANATFGAAADTQRSASHVFTNVAGTAEFAATVTPSDTVGVAAVGDCTTTPTTCLTLTQSSDTVAIGSGTATTLSLAGTKSVALQRTITAGGTVGAQTINKQAGTLNVAAGQASIALTNSTITTSSIIIPVLRTADATCTFVKSVTISGSVATFTLNTTCTAETSLGFVVWN